MFCALCVYKHFKKCVLYMLCVNISKSVALSKQNVNL